MGIVNAEYLGNVSGITAQFTVPANVTELLTILGVGQAGAGGSAQNSGARGGGGAGGAFVQSSNVPVTPGEVLDIFVPGQNSTSGASGAATTIKRGATTIFSAPGGPGGGNASTALGLSGAAGSGTTTGAVGDTAHRGGNGSAGVASTRTGAGGGGAAPSGNGNDAVTTTGGATRTAFWFNGGAGGPGSTSSASSTGVSGSSYGGAGSGARAADNTLRLGGVGERGALVFSYSSPDATGVPTAASFCDAFSGGDDADIDGRTMDGCGGTAGGTYAFDSGFNIPGDALPIVSGVLVGPDNFDEVQYGVPDALCGAVNPIGGRLYLKWRNLDSISSPETCTLIWQDDLSGASGSLAGRAHNGGSAGTGTYQRIDSGTGSFSGEAQLDGSGELYWPESAQLAAYAITGLTLPANFDVVLEVKRTSVNSGTAGGVGVTVRGSDTVPASGTQFGRKNFGLVYSSEDPSFTGDAPVNDTYHGKWTGWVNEGTPFGNLITGSASADPPGDQGIDIGDTNSLRFRVRAGSSQMWSYFAAATGLSGACAADWRIATGVQDGEFGGTPLGNTTGNIGIRNRSAGLSSPNGLESSYRITKISIYQYTPAVSGTVFYTEEAIVVLAQDTGAPTGYQVVFIGERSTGTFTLATELWEYGGTGGPFGFFQPMRANRFTTNSGVTVDIDTPCICEATLETDSVSSHRIIFARVNGTVVARFDLDSDTNETGQSLGAGRQHTGYVGLGAYAGDEDSGTGGTQRAMEISKFEILCEVTGYPCSGGPENPYPTDPPPQAPPPLPYVFKRKQGLWRPVPAELEASRGLGAWRTLVPQSDPLPTAVRPRGQGLWRHIVPDLDAEPPPPDTDLPPYFDPCGTLTEIPGDTVTPLPLIDLMFGMGQMPTTVLGGVFNGTKMAAGPWIPDEVARCAARSSFMVSAQGGYAQFRTGGLWDIDKYKAFVLAKLVPILAAMTDPAHFGYSMLDDFRSASLWPPNGVPDVDIADLLSYLRAHLPGVRIGIRGLPSQFSTNLGFDFYDAQYVSWRSTAAAFRAKEQGLAIARGSLILLSMNYIHGGDGSSGIRVFNGTMNSGKFEMSAAEIVSYASQLYTDRTNLAGALGYTYDPTFLALPGIIDAMTTARNYLSAL